jgi:hypothetical protein
MERKKRLYYLGSTERRAQASRLELRPRGGSARSSGSEGAGRRAAPARKMRILAELPSPMPMIEEPESPVIIA